LTNDTYVVANIHHKVRHVQSHLNRSMNV